MLWASFWIARASHWGLHTVSTVGGTHRKALACAISRTVYPILISPKKYSSMSHELSDRIATVGPSLESGIFFAGGNRADSR